MIVMNITIPNPMTKPEAKMAHGTANKDVPIMVFQMEALEIQIQFSDDKFGIKIERTW